MDPSKKKWIIINMKVFKKTNMKVLFFKKKMKVL